MKGYLSVRETSYKWNVSERWVSKLAQDGRIPGVERFGRSWATHESRMTRGKTGRNHDICARYLNSLHIVFLMAWTCKRGNFR